MDTYTEMTIEQSIFPNKKKVQGFNWTSLAYENGFAYCKAQQPAVYSVSGVNFDLKRPYYLLMAKGPTAGASINIIQFIKLRKKTSNFYFFH